ncbi:MAG: hypothetical protein J5965_24130, partial [Aeriscardovia sp.]|nr:hypothetical protein [Aeriscardovia sp.]
MKQLYIILTNTLYGLGGGQLLTLRKAHFLKKMGYYVIIVYKARYGDFRLKEDFEEVRCIYIPEFGKPYNLVSNKNKKRALSTIIEAAGTYSLNESYIESHDTQTAIWGEVLSAQLGIPHFLYLIQETNMNRLHFYPYKRFYQYKLERNEFWGCNS